MSSTPYEPHASSLAAKVIGYFQQHRDEELSAADISIKFDTNISEVPVLLATAVAHQLLTMQSHRKAGIPGKLYSAGSALKARFAAPQAPASAWSGVANLPTASRVGKRLPALDLAKLQVQKGAPMPAKNAPAGTCRYDALFSKLTEPDTSVDVPAAYMGTLAKARDRWVKRNAGQCISIVRLDAGTCRVKRTA